MGILGKLAFWRKEPELPDVKGIGKESGFKGPGGFGESGVGKPGADFGEQGMEQGFDQLGLGKEANLPAETAPGTPGIEPGYGGGPAREFGQQRRQPRAFQKQQEWKGAAAPMTPIRPTESKEISRDFEVLSAKLDVLKASLDGINQRLANLERKTQEKKRW